MEEHTAEPEESKRRQAALVSEFAKLMNKGFPKDEMAKYDARVAALPDDERQKVQELTHLSEALKFALTGRDSYRPR
jgi:hypothetical protein